MKRAQDKLFACAPHLMHCWPSWVTHGQRKECLSWLTSSVNVSVSKQHKESSSPLPRGGRLFSVSSLSLSRSFSPLMRITSSQVTPALSFERQLPVLSAANPKGTLVQLTHRLMDDGFSRASTHRHRAHWDWQWLPHTGNPTPSEMLHVAAAARLKLTHLWRCSMDQNVARASFKRTTESYEWQSVISHQLHKNVSAS